MSVAKVRGELHCYSCGYVAARIEGERDEAGLKARLITPAVGPGVRLHRGAAPRCGRCGGRVYLDEVEVMRPSPAETAAAIRIGELFYPSGSTSTLVFPPT